jgi:nucleoporin NUP159
LLYQDGQIVMINMETKATIATFGQGITAACWSVKGKQIVCGDQAGNLTQYTPEGEAKTTTPAPPSLQGRGMRGRLPYFIYEVSPR